MLNPFNDCSSTDEDNDLHYNSYFWPTEYTTGWSTDPLRTTFDIAYTGNSGILPDNFLCLSGVYGPHSLWSADQFACPAVTGASSEAGTQLFGAPLLQQPSFPDGSLCLREPPPHWHPSVCEAATLDEIERTLVPHFVHAHAQTQKPTAPQPSTHVSAPGLQARSAPPRSRCAPYRLGRDATRRVDLSAPVYQCQWVDGARTCAAVVAGTKSGIAQHLHAAHGIRLRADKTTQRCLWEGCGRQMRGDCIPRHVLAVHIRDKVTCPSCRLRFARVDSMQRHQRSAHLL